MGNEPIDSEAELEEDDEWMIRYKHDFRKTVTDFIDRFAIEMGVDPALIHNAQPDNNYEPSEAFNEILERTFNGEKRENLEFTCRNVGTSVCGNSWKGFGNVRVTCGKSLRLGRESIKDYGCRSSRYT